MPEPTKKEIQGIFDRILQYSQSIDFQVRQQNFIKDVRQLAEQHEIIGYQFSVAFEVPPEVNVPEGFRPFVSSFCLDATDQRVIDELLRITHIKISQPTIINLN